MTSLEDKLNCTEYFHSCSTHGRLQNVSQLRILVKGNKHITVLMEGKQRERFLFEPLHAQQQFLSQYLCES